MLKSNCKKVKERIRRHLLDAARASLKDYLPAPEYDYKGCTTETEIKATPMTVINRIFCEEKAYEIKRCGRFEAFRDWLQGLCHALPVYDGVYEHSRELLAVWMEQTEAEAQRYSDEQADITLLRLLYREFEEMVELEKSGGEK